MNKLSSSSVIVSLAFVLVIFTFWNSYKPVNIIVESKPKITEDIKNIESEVTPLNLDIPLQATKIEDREATETIDLGDGKTMKGLMVNGVKMGLWTYYKDGNVYQKITFDSDIMDGYVVVYDANGRKLSEGEYSNGVQSGIWHVFNEGNLQYIESYDNGRRINYRRMY